MKTVHKRTISVRISKDDTTVLKGIAILSVIIAHAYGNDAFIGIPLLNNPTILSEFCQAGICTFLLLSGYGVYCSFIQNGLDNFWNRKLTYIILPASVIQIIWLIIVLLFSSEKATISYGYIINDIFCISQKNSLDGSLWYLSYALFCYALFYFCFQLLSINVAFPTFLSLSLFLMPISKVCWENSFYCVSSFAIGIIIANFTSSKEIFLSSLTSIILLFFSITVFLCYYFSFRENWVLDNIASNCISLGLILTIKLFGSKKCRFLRFIGSNSFIIYLLQGKIICRFPYHLAQKRIQKIALFLLVLSFNVVLSVLINQLNLLIKNFIQNQKTSKN